MQIITDLQEKNIQNACVATIGMFDGVHRGHTFLLDLVRQTAKRHGLASTVITFDAHPAMVVSHAAPPLLLTLREKLELLEQTAVDRCIVLPFDAAMASLTAFAFMQQVLRDALGVQVLVMGYNHRFGSEQSSDANYYVKCGSECGIQVLTAPKFGQVNSSSIRAALAEGNVSLASELLGRPYMLSGVVVHGCEMGRQLGFPTANLQVSPEKLVPGGGVYAVRVELDGEIFAGMMNIGSCPTFDMKVIRRPEVHILNFNRDIYGAVLHVSFMQRIRDERRFNSADELILQLQRDAREVSDILNRATIGQ